MKVIDLWFFTERQMLRIGCLWDKMEFLSLM